MPRSDENARRASGGKGAPRRRGFGRPPGRSGDAAGADALWLFGLHAVADALANPKRVKKRLLVTPNALMKLEAQVAAAGVAPEVQDPRRFAAPLDPNSVHQGAALETEPLDWGPLSEICAPERGGPPARVVLLDQVTDPHNVGAVLRSAEVFGARAVIGTRRRSAPESGALAKSASGALERQPYLRPTNLAQAMGELQELGYVLLGLDGDAPLELSDAAKGAGSAPLGLALGAEGPGLRQLTKETCDALVRIPAAGGFGSLNLSNAAAIALYETRPR